MSSFPYYTFEGKKHLYLCFSQSMSLQFGDSKPTNNFLFVKIKNQKIKFAIEKSFDSVCMTDMISLLTLDGFSLS